MISINRWGIKTRVVFLAMAPVLLITIVLTLYINKARNNDLNREIEDKGQLIATNLAMAMEFAVATGNVLQIQKLAENSLSQDVVVGISITNMQGEAIFTSGIGKADNKTIQQYMARIVSSEIEFEELFGQEETKSDQMENELGIVKVFISTTPYLLRQKNIYLTTAFIVIAGLLTSIGLALLIGRGVIRPVRGVIETVDALTRGQLDARMHETSGGELGKLSNGLNNLAETIQGSQAILESKVNKAVAELEEKFVELQAKNIELDKARSEAMLAKDAKSRFLANMSHEIRTPLNAIIGFSRQLGKTRLSSQQDEYIWSVSRAARQLQTVIDDILSLSKLESNMMRIVTTEFRLRDFLEDTVLMLSQSASEKAIEMVLLIDADVPDVVLGDPDRVSQVIINLVNNAIKFTQQGSIIIHVRYELEDTPDFVHFHITDTGCGISFEAQKNIFSPFYQEDQEPRKSHGGTGLGLVICKNLVELMGGEIGFSSEQGKGSEFYFNIPMETVSLYKPLVTDEEVNAFLLDEHKYSRRAIRNTLVHMGINTFAVENMDRLLKVLNNRNADIKQDVVMLSLPAGYQVTDFGEDYLDIVRSHFDGRIIVLLAGDYSDAHDISQLDSQISIIGKPLRSHSLQNILILGKSAGQAENKIELRSGKHLNRSIHNILVVEDNELNQRYIMDLLSDYAVNVVCVDNGIKAVDACKNTYFDMIFMDLHMPELDGIDAIRQIRALPGEVANTPVIAITADIFVNDNDKLTEEGFTDLMLKPMDEDRLDELINTYINLSASDNKTTAVTKHGVVSNMPEDMVEKLFESLYKDYTELAQTLIDENFTRMHELAHEVLGLVSYFKVGSLADDIRHLQDAIKESDFDNASNLLNACIEQTRKVERDWRAS